MPANLLPLEHLTDADFDFLAAAVSPRPDARDRIARLLRDGGEAVQRALEDRRTHRALQEGEAARHLSPYLLFSVLLHRHLAEERAAHAQGQGAPGGGEPAPEASPQSPSPGASRDTTGAPPASPAAADGTAPGSGVFILNGEPGPAPEGRSGPGSRLLLESPWTLHYLAELLASFAYTPPGIAAFTLGGRQYRLPLAEVDLAALNKVALLAAEAERLSIYRRLGDLTLFLSSVAVEPAEGGQGEAGKRREPGRTATGHRPGAQAATGAAGPAEGATPSDGEEPAADVQPGGASGVKPAGEPARPSRPTATPPYTRMPSSTAETVPDRKDPGAGVPYSDEELEREGRRFYEYASQHRGARTTYLGSTLPVLAAQYGAVRSLLRKIVQQDLPQVYPGGLAQLAARWGNAPQPGVVALSAPDGRRA
ncbi:hypothetical protein Tmar_2113 [Thermaerobacter marianensis DSM 12885]|uniref:Uncharacterized protein n=1 Tax=Thermaerobacter marianensis (strain ATCC 700841 / DSM 12885 / JCM 10246 / 7p75a) TaxID=644966 RepID=E6SJW1_THEM7|nr:hypothetical protein [Thermaerobacter marianensis]ADU52194.1 hypothetical protein Tmar_2113 [Thermaerobacter marianensis DSM 12885]